MIVTEVATTADLEPAAGVLRRAAERLVDSGLSMWNPEQFTVAALEPILVAGELYLARFEARVAGVMYLQERDALFWDDQPEGESLFIHKLAVDNEFRGRGVALALLLSAQTEAKARGKRWLRLDCRERPKLQALYESFGFRLRDRVQRLGMEFLRYEQRI